MKILHIFPVLKFGGAPIVVLNLLKLDKSNEHIVVSKSNDKNLLKEFLENSNKYYNINIQNVSLFSIGELLKIILKEKPNVIHAHGKGGAFYTFVVSLILFKRAKVIYTFHGFNNKFGGLKSLIYKLFEKFFSFFVDQYIAVSNTEKEKVLESQMFNKNKVVVIPNGIKVEKKKLSNQKIELLKKYDFNIISLSRISPQKNLETMLYAFHDCIKNVNVNIGLHILGGYIDDDQNYANKIFDLCNKLDLNKNVVFWGDIPFASSYLHHFDLYWSTALWEGLPTAIMESMLEKVIVVASDCIGNIDLVNEDTGVLTPQAPPKIIADILIQTILDNKRDILIENAHKFILENYTVEKYVDNILEIYKRVSDESIAVR